MTAKERKERPVYSGVLKYFPKALLEIARVSYVGHEQHNAGTPMRWDRSKSADEADALVRHLMEAGTLDTDGLRHTAKAAWRCLALLEKELEAAGLGASGENVAESHEAPDHNGNHVQLVHAPERLVPNGKSRGSKSGLNGEKSHAASVAPAHDELYALATPCQGGCGTIRYPQGTCRKCQGKAKRSGRR